MGAARYDKRKIAEQMLTWNQGFDNMALDGVVKAMLAYEF